MNGVTTPINANRRGEIYIATQETKETGIITFKDTAKGASPEVVEHMFDDYFSKRNGSTGLGLSFCKAVMKSFNGKITVNSVEGEYIEFMLIFPKFSQS